MKPNKNKSYEKVQTLEIGMLFS